MIGFMSLNRLVAIVEDGRSDRRRSRRCNVRNQSPVRGCMTAGRIRACVDIVSAPWGCRSTTGTPAAPKGAVAPPRRAPIAPRHNMVETVKAVHGICSQAAARERFCSSERRDLASSPAPSMKDDLRRRQGQAGTYIPGAATTRHRDGCALASSTGRRARSSRGDILSPRSLSDPASSGQADQISGRHLSARDGEIAPKPARVHQQIRRQPVHFKSASAQWLERSRELALPS